MASIGKSVEPYRNRVYECPLKSLPAVCGKPLKVRKCLSHEMKTTSRMFVT